MKLGNVILLALSAAFLIIGIYEGITMGFSFAYVYVMLSVVFFFWFTYRKRG